jgi:hypothetical protein
MGSRNLPSESYHVDNETCWLMAPDDKFFLCPCRFTASLLKGLKHANIVLLHDIIHTKETLTLVFEYVVSEIRRGLDCMCHV